MAGRGNEWTMGCVDEFVTKWMKHYVGEMLIIQLVHGYQRVDPNPICVLLRPSRKATIVGNAGGEEQTVRGSGHLLGLAMHTLLLFLLIHLFLCDKGQTCSYSSIARKQGHFLLSLRKSKRGVGSLSVAPREPLTKYLLPSFMTLAPWGQRPWVHGEECFHQGTMTTMISLSWKLRCHLATQGSSCIWVNRQRMGGLCRLQDDAHSARESWDASPAWPGRVCLDAAARCG